MRMWDLARFRQAEAARLTCRRTGRGRSAPNAGGRRWSPVWAPFPPRQSAELQRRKGERTTHNGDRRVLQSRSKRFQRFRSMSTHASSLSAKNFTPLRTCRQLVSGSREKNRTGTFRNCRISFSSCFFSGYISASFGSSCAEGQTECEETSGLTGSCSAIPAVARCDPMKACTERAIQPPEQSTRRTTKSGRKNCTTPIVAAAKAPKHLASAAGKKISQI